MNNSPPAPLVHISLFSGIGGFEISAQRIGWQNAASCEINDFGHKILSYHFPLSYHHRDVKTLTYKILNEELTIRFGQNWRSGGIILTGGFPCQGFSVAGLRAGTDDDRYLWPEYLRLIDEINPDWVCGENVTGIITMEDKSGIYRDVFAKVENRKITRFDQIDYYEAIYIRQSKMLINSICESLEERGFEVQPFAIPAASVEAPHKRERIWFIACNSKSNPIGNGISGKSSGIRMDMEGGQLGTAGRFESSIGINSTDNDGINSDSYSNDAGGYRYGQTGQTQRIAKIERHKRKRIWTIIERIGNKESSSDPDYFYGRIRAERKNGEKINYGGKHSVADSVGNRGRKSMGRKQPKQFNENGKAKRINANADPERFQGPGKERIIPNKGTETWATTSGSGCPSNGWRNFPTQSPVCSGNDGIPRELDGITFSKWRNESIRGFGNAVVPEVVDEIFSAIQKYRILAEA